MLFKTIWFDAASWRCRMLRLGELRYGSIRQTLPTRRRWMMNDVPGKRLRQVSIFYVHLVNG